MPVRSASLTSPVAKACWAEVASEEATGSSVERIWAKARSRISGLSGLPVSRSSAALTTFLAFAGSALICLLDSTEPATRRRTVSGCSRR